jgi:uroporphyrinogen-III synthase
MRLLVTRPENDARAFAQLLSRHGHEAILAPLMEIRSHPGPEIAFTGVQAVLATSANGIRALAARTSRRDIAVYAVGPQTTEAAETAGFAPVHNAEGNSQALVEFVARHANPQSGALLHAAGEETAGAVRESLIARRFQVETQVLYGAHPATTLPPEAARALSESAADGVMLFSPKSAGIFASLVASAGLAPRCASITAYCISAATAAALAPLTFQRLAIAASPNQDAMLALLK